MSHDTSNVALPMNDYSGADDAQARLQEMKKDVIVFAAHTVLGSAPNSFTAYAAIRVLDWAVKDIPLRQADDGEMPRNLAKLADMLREIVVADPDGATRWVGALRAANSGITRLDSPEKWTPSKAQIAAAMSALNIEDRARIIVKFNAAGQLVARPAGAPDADYQIVVPRGDEVTS
ncbi:hypothetical protein [Paracoccus denitrificans]|jgi:hypothetical protein|uniref:Uncharacterized protein n=1 Tax=Paracoccus denitrificans (strain Pd 1222) TaxID=318586 RepID=A1B0P1_PARDP|nr:hypothetical protein [Paracoccus denitrificans]ABL69085.1 hypothetical protein Pden_0974 [Paracoccus denitrificans PD1222]MBB4630300.1 hypothetical protein [Paracoccus denitrificans]MCU7431664.1 hypothetical protein [Paracoccus denitrificans]QAR27117.1 hypothetical protein EO213_12835 [Paracoccus denitrificans]UPV96081.1 hypothetical protein M0K93_05700 [Paracoccus denitrificans]